MFDPRELAAALHRGAVDYVIIGGLAVAAHGYVRATEDLDIVPAPDRGNLERLARVLRELGAELLGTGDFDPASSRSTRGTRNNSPRVGTSSFPLVWVGST
ncbi:MAG TPA: hypothetical protein VHX88_21105 [Solirubrobacteraceae bacterium]|jgi:hypothetical protein|nr:hypothetical protein [Solirubrobacteraceae bacterium]